MAKRKSTKRDRISRRERPDIAGPDEREDMPGDQFAESPDNEAPTDQFQAFQQWFRRARDKTFKWRTEARECYDFRDGRQWSEEDAAKLELENRPCVTFNRVGSVVDSVAGLEISNRQEVRFIPRQLGASGVNELLTDAGKWVRDECNAEDEESDCFLDLIISGLGCCLSGDTLVAGGEVKLATARLYSGRIVQIDLENGQKLTGTPNHPVLTDMGWKPLIMLQEGDNLVNGDFLKRVQGFPVEKFDDVEARFEDVVKTFSAGRKALWGATPANHFYGDGFGSEVHVVYAERALFRKAAYALGIKKIKNALFVWNHHAGRVIRPLLLGSSNAVRPLFAAEGHPAFNIAHSPFSHGFSRFIIPQRVTGSPEPLSNGFTIKAKSLRNLLGRQFFDKVEMLSLSQGNLGDRAAAPLGPKLEPRSPKPSLNDCVGYAELLANFREWKPLLEIEARKLFGGDRVFAEFKTRVKRRVVNVEHDYPVYDLGTTTGIFIAGGVIVSNTETRLDYDVDPDGKLMIDRVDPLEMYWDASATKRNLNDARHVFRVKQVGIEQAREMFPDENPNDLDAVWAKDIEGDVSNPHDATIAPYYKVDQSPDIDKRTALITLVECQWWEHVTKYRVADPMTGKAVILSKEEYSTYKTRAKTLNIPVVSAPMKTRRYQRAIIGSKTLKTWDGPDKGGFTYKFMTGKRDRNKGTWYGLVRAMLDPQRWANKWLAQVMFIINSNAKGGLFAEASAFENPQEAEATYSSPNSITILNDGGLEKVKQKEMAQFPAGIDHLMQFAISSIRDVSGVNLELLGMANKDQAGILEHQRKQAGMTILAGFFDSLREYRKDQGKLMLYYITNFLSDGRLIRIGGASDGKYVPLIHEPGLAEYDVIVDDTPSSPNQKEQAWIAITQMMPFLAKIGLPPKVLLEVLKYSPLPTSLVADVTEIVTNTPPQPNPEMLKAQTLAQKGQADVKVAEAQAQGHMADAQAETIRAAADARNADAERFATMAAGMKSLAEAQVIQGEPHFDALDMILKGLDQAHSHQLDMDAQEHDQKLATQQANEPAAAA